MKNNKIPVVTTRLDYTYNIPGKIRIKRLHIRDYVGIYIASYTATMTGTYYGGEG